MATKTKKNELKITAEAQVLVEKYNNIFTQMENESNMGMKQFLSLELNQIVDQMSHLLSRTGWRAE